MNKSAPPAGKEVFVPSCTFRVNTSSFHKQTEVFYKGCVWNLSLITYYVFAFPKKGKLSCKGCSLYGIL